MLLCLSTKKLYLQFKTLLEKNTKRKDDEDTVKTNNVFNMTELFLSVYKSCIYEMVTETNSQVNDALLSLKNYIKELVNISLNRPTSVIHEKLTTMLVFNDTVNGIVNYMPSEYHISF